MRECNIRGYLVRASRLDSMLEIKVGKRSRLFGFRGLRFALPYESALRLHALLKEGWGEVQAGRDVLRISHLGDKTILTVPTRKLAKELTPEETEVLRATLLEALREEVMTE